MDVYEEGNFSPNNDENTSQLDDQATGNQVTQNSTDENSQVAPDQQDDESNDPQQQQQNQSIDQDYQDINKIQNEEDQEKQKYRRMNPAPIGVSLKQHEELQIKKQINELLEEGDEDNAHLQPEEAEEDLVKSFSKKDKKKSKHMEKSSNKKQNNKKNLEDSDSEYVGFSDYEQLDENNIKKETSKEAKRRKKKEKKEEKQLLEKIFKKLEKYSLDSEWKAQQKEGSKYKKHHLGLKNNRRYCLKSDIHHFHHAEQFNHNREVVTDLSIGSQLRVALTRASHIALPQVHIEMKKKLKKSRTFDFPKNLTLIMTMNPNFHNFHQVGKNLFCLFQIYSKLPGAQHITQKSIISQTVDRYQRYFREKTPDYCVNEVDFLPKTLSLSNTQQCRQFFNNILIQENSEFDQAIKKQFQQQKQGNQNGQPSNQNQQQHASNNTYSVYKVKYLLKVGSGKPKSYGVWTLVPNSEKLQELTQMYDNGDKCGQIGDSLLIQSYVQRPLLVEGYKFDFRVYMVVASVNPLIVYAQKSAEISRCALPWSIFDYTTPQRHLCESFVSRQLLREYPNDEAGEAAFKKATGGMNRSAYVQNLQLRWSANDVQQKLLDQKSIDDPNWLQNYLLPETYKIFIYLAKMSQPFFPTGDSRFFEFFAPDITLDENKKLWLLGVNQNPRMESTSDKWNQATINDILEIQYAYLQSRFKRIKKFVEEIMNDIKQKGGQFDNIDWEEKQKKFKKINQNYLEKDFSINSSNSFVKILDEGATGDQYMGYIKKGCI